jgi:hypothetical protein
MNYWQTKQIHWHDYTPEDIFIKSNPTTRKLEGEIQTCSYKTKEGFFATLKSAKGRGTGVCVKLMQLKDDHPCAEIDFLKYGIEKAFAGGDPRWTSPNAICYIHSHHVNREYINDPKHGWVLSKTPLVVGDKEGYQVSFSANQSQFGGDMRECQEMMDISFAVMDFLVERILPLKRKKALTGVA